MSNEKNDTPNLSVALANAFDGWYTDGLVENGNYVVLPHSVSRFPDAQKRIDSLNTNIKPLWLETWRIYKIVLGSTIHAIDFIIPSHRHLGVLKATIKAPSRTEALQEWRRTRKLTIFST